ncbi:mobilization protein, partial [Escherichia coli]|nr:mobilization protein [Escherichia coli]
LLERYQKTTVDTMDAHWKTVLKMSVKRWLWLIIVSVLMFATTGSLLWYQGMKINANMNILREQKESLEKLNAKTWGVRYHEDSNGRFLVLPKGMKAETNWTKDNGKLNAVRLVQE